MRVAVFVVNILAVAFGNSSRFYHICTAFVSSGTPIDLLLLRVITLVLLVVIPHRDD